MHGGGFDESIEKVIASIAKRCAAISNSLILSSALCAQHFVGIVVNDGSFYFVQLAQPRLNMYAEPVFPPLSSS